MTDLSVLNIGGTAANVKDAQARSAASLVTAAEEYDRQALCGQYRGRSLASTFAGEISGYSSIYAWLKARINAGNFTGLRIWDWMDVPITADDNVLAQTVKYRIAAIDPYYQCSDSPRGHHIAFVPSAPVIVTGDKGCGASNSHIMWNTTATNQGTADEKHPYLCSHLHDWEVNDFFPCLPTELQNVILTQRSLVEERYSSSSTLTAASSWSWADLGKVWSLSEMEVYGCAVWGTMPYSIGYDCHFPIFDSTHARIMGSRVTWWLRSVPSGSSTNACYVYYYGYATSTSAANASIRPRPCFLIG